MFKCKVCAEKELRISELKEQIAYFKSLLAPAPRVNKYELETDNLLNGGAAELIDDVHTEEEQQKADLIQLEHDRILAGTYN